MAQWAISGGSGFLGLHLACRLACAGQRVRTLDLLPAPHPDCSEQGSGLVDPLLGDVRDGAACGRLCTGADVVVHAAVALPIRGNASEIRAVNVEATATLLAAAAEAGVRRVVFVSSAVVYGLARGRPVSERTPPAAIDAYGASKVEAEAVCRAFARRGLELVILRPSAVVGPGRLGAFGILFDWVREGRRVYTLGSGANRYQLVDIDDLTDAVVLAGEEPVAGETFNVGATVTGTVRADLESLIGHAGSGSTVVPVRAGFARAALRALDLAGLSPLSEWHYRSADHDVVASVEKARRLLGWQPRRSSAEALIRAYDWFLTSGDAARSGDTHRARWDERALALVRRAS